MIRTILEFAVRALRLPKRTITRGDGRPYLERWYLGGEAGGLKYFGEGHREPRWWQRPLARDWLPCVYVHRFVSGDDEPELHNHPWEEATSLILAGGYVEERRSQRLSGPFPLSENDPTRRFEIVSQRFLPGMFNYILRDTYHRVQLLEGDCWSLIFCGRKVSSWGFWDPETGEELHWRAHVERRKAS
jgi:hypothetical protein